MTPKINSDRPIPPAVLDALDLAAREALSNGQQPIGALISKLPEPPCCQMEAERFYNTYLNFLTGLQSGVALLAQLRERFGDAGPDGVTHYEDFSEESFLVQRYQNKIVGGLKAVRGETVLIAGGRAFQSPVSVGEIYRAMGKYKINRASEVGLYAELARKRWAEKQLEKSA